jgi:hypothetical protein
MNHGQAKHPSKPDVAWGSEPNCDRAISAYVQPALCINGMQPAAHIIDPGAEAGKHIRLKINVTELNYSSPSCADKPALLPRDASVTDGAFGIVPDRELRVHFCPCHA